LRTKYWRALRSGAWLVPVVAAAHAVGLVAVQQPSEPQLGVSLSPAVVMLSGQPGQAHRQTLRLTNHTLRELAFTLVAQDVVAHEGRRVFVDAGVRSDSVAATAVFSPGALTIPPGQVGTSEVTLTVPVGTGVRGIATIFRGGTAVGSRSGVAMIASLGCLITFTLSDDVRLEASPPEVSPQTSTTPFRVLEWVANTGAEPVVASGAMAILNNAGALVGKVAVEPHRLMPGERLAMTADYPTLLSPGRYRAVLSFEYEKKVLTSAVDVVVPASSDDQRASDRGAGVRR
jgi:hypothetical protein